MGKLLPHNCSFVPSTGQSARLSPAHNAALDDQPYFPVTIQGQECHVILEEPGMYLLHGRLNLSGNFQAGDIVRYCFFDTDLDSEVGGYHQMKVPFATHRWEQEFTWLHPINSARRIFLCVGCDELRGQINGLRTGIQWVRLNNVTPNY